MPSIISDIVLRARGGEQVASEVNKATKAYDDAAKSAQKLQEASDVTPSGGGAPGEGRQGMFGRIRDWHERRQGEAAQRRREADERQGRGGREERFRRGAIGGMQRAAGAVGAAGSPGGMMTAFGQGLTNLGQTLPFVGAAVAGVGIGMMLTQRLAQREHERTDVLVGGGITQRLGIGYDRSRRMRMNLMESGIPRGMIDPFLQSYTQQGGTMDPAGMRRGLEATARYGLQGGNVGRFMALQNMAGGETQGMFGVAEQAFGRGRMGTFIDRMADSIEEAMTRGMKRGSEELQSVGLETARLMTAFTQGGGLTPQGALALQQQVTKTIQTGMTLQSPEQLRRFMFFHKPGQSYMETMKQMQGPSAFREYFQGMKERFGDDEESLMFAMMGEFPQMSPRQMEALLKGMDFEEGMAEGGVRALPGAERKMPAMPARQLYRGRQTELTAGLEKAAAEGLAGFNTELNKAIETLKEYNLLPGGKSGGLERFTKKKKVGPAAAHAGLFSRLFGDDDDEESEAVEEVERAKRQASRKRAQKPREGASMSPQLVAPEKAATEGLEGLTDIWKKMLDIMSRQDASGAVHTDSSRETIG